MPCPSELVRSHRPFPIPTLSSFPQVQYTYFNSLPIHFPLQILLQFLSLNKLVQTLDELKMCLFSSPKPRRRHAYIEETYAPRPVSRHSHHHHGGHGRSSYTSVTRTSRPVSREYIAPARMSQNSYRRSAPVVVEERRSTRSYHR
jgi:hypothetical protein